jgi:CBS domain-containing protein
MKTGVKIMEAMTKKPISASPDISINDAAKLMRKEHVGSLLIKKGDQISGMFTEHDIVRSLAMGVDLAKAKVSDLMNRNIISIEPMKDVYEAMLLMNKEDLRRLPVILNNKCIGLITLKDILKIQPTLMELIVDRIKLRH